MHTFNNDNEKATSPNTHCFRVRPKERLMTGITSAWLICRYVNCCEFIMNEENCHEPNRQTFKMPQNNRNARFPSCSLFLSLCLCPNFLTNTFKTHQILHGNLWIFSTFNLFGFFVSFIISLISCYHSRCSHQKKKNFRHLVKLSKNSLLMEF